MDHYARVYSFLLRIAPRIETEIIDMERELERRKDDPRSKQGFFQNYGGGLESLSAPSSRHCEPYYARTSLSIPIERHIAIHKQGLAVLRELPLPEAATSEDKERLYKDISYGRLEHWFQEPLGDGSVLGVFVRRILRGDLAE
jgi:hypothetical protein